jgi:predicted transposase YdaD
MVVRSIIEGIQSDTTGDFAGNRYFKQLRIFVQLRNSIEQQFETVMQSVSTFFKEENDFLYRKGEAKGEARGEIKGEEKKSHSVVKNLILKIGLSDEQVAEVAEVDPEYVKKVREQLGL